MHRKVGSMPPLSRIPVALALAMVLVSVLPTRSLVAQPRSEPAQPKATFEDSRTQGPRTAQAQDQNARSVLGIEVRSSHEKNIGRIADLLVDRNGGVEAAVIEFGGFLGVGTRKIAIAWQDLRFDSDGKQLVAILDIPRDQLRTAPDYKPDEPTIVTKVIRPLTPSIEEPPHKFTQPPPPSPKQSRPLRKQRHHLGRERER
jgi:hypothetical protein